MRFDSGPDIGSGIKSVMSLGITSELKFSVKNEVINSIKKFVKKDNLIERGFQYYQEKKVRILSMHGGSLEATVWGSKIKPYRVYIRFGKKGSPKFALCTCPHFPTQSTCKHVAAVLFQYFEKNITAEDILQYQKQVKTESVIIDLQKFNKRADLIDLTKYFKTDTGKIVRSTHYDKKSKRPDESTRKKYRLVFIIKRYTDYYGLTSWVISAGLQYIKRNGEGGMIYNFDDSKITEPVELEEKILLNRLKMIERNKDLLNRHIDYIVSNKLKNVFIEIGLEPVQIEYKKLEKLNIMFALKSFENNDFQFAPLVYLPGENESQSSTINPINIFLDGLSTYFLTAEGLLFYRKNDEMVYKLMDLIYYKKKTFTQAEITQIKHFLKENNSGISIEFNARKIKLTRTLPKILLELEDRYSSLVIHLLFEYQGIDVEYRSPADFVLHEISGEEYSIIIRDHQYENSINKYLHSTFCPSVTHNNSDILEVNKNMLDFLLQYGKALIDLGAELRLKSNKKKIYSKMGKVGLSVKSGIDWFDLEAVHIDPDGTMSRVELDPEVISRGLVRIGNTYTIISQEEVQKLHALIEEGMDHKGRLRVSKYNVSIIDRFYEDIQNRGDPQVKTAHQIAQKLRDFTRMERYQLPQRFGGKLRNYQYAGYNWLFFLNSYGLGGCLADDMGLGKTVQALALMQKLKEQNEITPSLIIVPVNTISNWESEINRFTRGIEYYVHHGQNKADDEESLKGWDIILTSYHTLRSDIELFRRVSYRYVILDEAQYIKNSKSQLFKAVKLLKAEHRLSLTGTPIENNTFELWSQMDFLNTGLLGNINKFKKEYAKQIESESNEKKLNKLRQTVYPFILRRKKEDVAKELPEKSEIILYSEMDNKQRNLYSELNNYYREKVSMKLKKDGIERSAMVILSALLRLRQVALFPRLINEKYSKIKSCKFEQLKETVNEILDENHKILIFSQFVECLKIIKNYFKSKVEISYIDGSVSAAKRKIQIERFNNDDRVKLFLLSLKAGGTGINLTAADYVVLYDPWWNPAVESQAVDRTHRIGQDKKVIAYRMIVRDTIEEKILKLQEKKKKLVNELITEDAGLFKSLRREDIMALF